MIFLEAAALAWRNPSYVTRNPTGITEGARAAYATAKAMKLYRDFLTGKGLLFCCFCGDEHSLHVHHIYPISVAPELADDPENFIMLCADCHFRVGHGGNWKSYVVNVGDLCRIRQLILTR